MYIPPVYQDKRLIDKMSSGNSESTDICSIPIAPQQEQQLQDQSRNDENHRIFPPSSSSLPPVSSPQQSPASEDTNYSFAETMMNMSLYDAPRWGWTAVGGISDILSPHERSRRYSTCLAYRKKAQRTKRSRRNGIGSGGTKSVATLTAPRLKDPPCYPIESSIEKSASGTVPSHRSESISSQPLSLPAPASQSVSEISRQQPQNLDSKGSNSESKRMTVSAETNRTNTISNTGGLTGEGATNDSIPPRNEHKRQDSSDDTEDKKQSPCDSDQSVLRDKKTGKIMKEQCTPSDKSVNLPQQPPKIDIGLEIVGISSNDLGMTIERQRQQQSTTEGINDNNDKDDDARCTENNISTTGRRTKKYVKIKSSRRSGGIKSKYDCHVRSLGVPSLSSDATIIGGAEKIAAGNDEMILDVYAYHQGREGMEARDAETGELLFTQQATDTNYDFDKPKSTFQITIEFPLEDDDDDDDFDDNIITNGDKKNTTKHDKENNDDIINSPSKFINDGTEGSSSTKATESMGRSKKEKQIAMYREVLTWDLLDPNTPTPLAFATSICTEYGLSFGQTMELAARIDKQIERHVTETSQYREPIAERTNLQELPETRKLGPILQPYRYDEIIQTGKEGGTFKPRRECRVIAKPRSSTAAGNSRQHRNGGKLSSETATKISSTARRRDNNKSKAQDTSEGNLEDELVDELLAEVKKRASKEFGQSHKTGALECHKNPICHICKKRVPVGYSFACNMKNHVYCADHVTKRLGLTKESGVYNYSSCPVCSLTCECARCVRKLKNVATVFKAKCIEQKKKVHEVHFPEILSTCVNVIPSKELNHAIDLVLEKRQQEIRRQKEDISGQQEEDSEEKCSDKSEVKKSRTVQLAGQTMVPRPPLSDFPREICNGCDFDARSTDVYFTVYSAEGKQPVSDVPDAWLDDNKGTKIEPEFYQSKKTKNHAEVLEDGNVDYCHICKTAGHLILCDFCPRGFHQDCLRNNNRSSPEGDRWECFACKNEKVGSDNDYLDGKESIDAISGAFLELNPTDDRALVGLEVLSIIHQMLSNLINYDFGDTFEKPVDPVLVPGYQDVVKHPMDIGMICSKLRNGSFAELLSGTFTMDDLVEKVLNDIELIWRNCIMFNVIGSSVARMAVVLRRRVKMICRRSIFDKLSDQVKKSVNNYARQFDDAWASGITASLSKEVNTSGSSISWKLRAIRSLKPRSDQKFIFKTTNGRPIAIVDSVNGRVVQLYSSVKSASKAVEIILKLGHRCEWNASASRTDLNVKLIAEKSRIDPNLFLFGYRWLFLDDLNEGRVTFLKTVHDIVEMQHNNCTFVFRSIEEALSSSHLPKTFHLDDLRKKLTALPRNGNWNEIEGIKWRRPLINEERGFLKLEAAVMSTDDNFGNGRITDSDNLPSWKNCAFLKKDLVTDRNLVGFDSIQLAHQDWIQTAISSPSFPASEAQTIENFQKYYLDGDRNVDGMIWQTVDGNNTTEQEEKKETTKNGNLADAMEIQDGGDSQDIRSESTEQGENNVLSNRGESRSESSMNESSSTTIAMNNDQQRNVFDSNKMTLEEPQKISRKRKFLDDNERDFSAGKKAHLPVVTVE